MAKKKERKKRAGKAKWPRLVFSYKHNTRSMLDAVGQGAAEIFARENGIENDVEDRRLSDVRISRSFRRSVDDLQTHIDALEKRGQAVNVFFEYDPDLPPGEMFAA